MKYLNPTQYADKIGVSRQRVHAWIKSRALPCWTPVSGVYRIDANQPRPKKKKGGRMTNEAKNAVDNVKYI